MKEENPTQKFFEIAQDAIEASTAEKDISKLEAIREIVADVAVAIARYLLKTATNQRRRRMAERTLIELIDV